MQARRAALVATALGAGLVIIPGASPAGAAVTAASAGTTVTVTMTGDDSVGFDCSGGVVRVNQVAVAPSVTCAALSGVSVNGDGGSQTVYGGGLDAAAFTANPGLTAVMGDGIDVLYESDAADDLQLGPGNDYVGLRTLPTNNTQVSLGTGTNDRVIVATTERDDTVTATSSGTTLTVAITNSGGSSTRVATGAERFDLVLGGGDDTATTTGITAGSSLTYLSIEAGAGDDTVTDGPVTAALFGGTGTNELSGGAGADAYWSDSDTDVLTDASDSNVDYVYDSVGLRSGGRTLSGFTSIDVYTAQAHQGDGSARVRPAAAGAATVTLSLTRPGQQQVPAGIGNITIGQAYVGSLTHRGLVDVVAVDQKINVTLPNNGTGLLDVTIPTGSWTTVEAGSNRSVTSAYGQISAANVDDIRVHGPWTDKDRGFAHRVVRDLMFRFASDSDINEVGAALTAGTSTRADVAAILMGTDEYRGLDVDRTFLKYLRRSADPGGRTYWINSIRNGKALWRFRAQLFGSNEYFTKAGGTNATYVEKAYADVLGRAPDPSGKTYWTNKLNAGADRGSVALQFLNSPEARRRLVDDQFLRFVDRKPTAGEQTTWVNALPGTTGEQDLIAFLVTTSAYYNRS